MTPSARTFSPKHDETAAEDLAVQLYSDAIAIGVAREFQSVIVGHDRATQPGAVNFGFQKSDRRVTLYYFYLLDAEFRPSFIKLCSYGVRIFVPSHRCRARIQTFRPPVV